MTLEEAELSDWYQSKLVKRIPEIYNQVRVSITALRRGAARILRNEGDTLIYAIYKATNRYIHTYEDIQTSILKNNSRRARTNDIKPNR
ncbi:14895_t:CDS:2, partial [Racocetra fulgida]